MQVGVGFSVKEDYLQTTQEAVNSAYSSLGKQTADLAILFTTKEFNHPLDLKSILKTLGEIPLLGASSTEIICAKGPINKGIVLLLFSFPEKTYFNTSCVEEVNKNNALSMGRNLGEKLLYGCKGNRRNLNLIFSSCLGPEGQNIFLGLQERVGKSFPIISASLQDGIYFNNASLNHSVSGVLFGGKLLFGLGVKHGWRPLGKPRKVTLSSNNAIIEIDGKPAASLYKDYLDKDNAGIKKELKRISKYYPIGIDITGKKEYLLRSLSDIETNNTLIFNGNIPKGSEIQLMISSKESCLQSTREAAELAKDALKGQKIKLLLILNSSARLSLLGIKAAEEIEIIKEVCGKDTPIAGIYTNAEYAPLNNAGLLGVSYFYNNSIVILTMTG